MFYVTLPLLIVIGLLIILVNLFTLATIFSSRLLTKPANYPIIFFLITATVQGFVVVPAYTLKHLKFEQKAAWICDLFRFPYFLCGHLLTLNLVLVCIDRLIATKYPLRYPKIVTRTSMTIAIIVETAVIFVVDLIPFGNKVRSDAGDKCVYLPWAEWSIAVIFGTIIVPLVFLTVSYAYIWVIAFRLHTSHPDLDGHRKISITKMFSRSMGKILELRATKTSALLIGVFVICWSPIAVYYLVENICGLCIMELFDENERPLVGFSVKAISFTSSILSPLAYCWRTREFQKELRKNLHKRRWKAARIALSFVSGGSGREKKFKPNQLASNCEGNDNDGKARSISEASDAKTNGNNNCIGDVEFVVERYTQRNMSPYGSQNHFHHTEDSDFANGMKVLSNTPTKTLGLKNLSVEFVDKRFPQQGETSSL
eukprot:gene485-1130_t